jgi:hypothetical protein
MKTFIARFIVMFSVLALSVPGYADERSAKKILKKADKKPADKKAADKKKQGAVKPMTPEQQKNR